MLLFCSCTGTWLGVQMPSLTRLSYAVYSWAVLTGLHYPCHAWPGTWRNPHARVWLPLLSAPLQTMWGSTQFPRWLLLPSTSLRRPVLASWLLEVHCFFFFNIFFFNIVFGCTNVQKCVIGYPSTYHLDHWDEVNNSTDISP